ncbi:MAG: hypothetical protein WDO70_06830 [Alphaproteobacteria bacterium]
MTEDYAQTKARQALSAMRGNKDEAQKLLIAWAVRDQTLLLGLAKPHMKSMASFALDQAAKEIAEHGGVKGGTLPPDILSRIMDQVGLRRSVPASQGAEQEPILVDPVRQANTWQTIAAAFKKKADAKE